MPATGDVAVGDGDVLGWPVVAESEAGFRADAVVPRSVDEAVGDAYVLAAVDVHAIAVGVDLEVVDGEVVDAGEQHPEVAALEDGEVAQYDVAAVPEADGLVAGAGLFGDVSGISTACGAVRAEAQPLAPEKAWPGDGEVADAVAPKQRVAPVVVAPILVGFPRRVRFGRVIGPAHVAGGLAG